VHRGPPTPRACFRSERPDSQLIFFAPPPNCARSLLAKKRRPWVTFEGLHNASSLDLAPSRKKTSSESGTWCTSAHIRVDLWTGTKKCCAAVGTAGWRAGCGASLQRSSSVFSGCFPTHFLNSSSSSSLAVSSLAGFNDWLSSVTACSESCKAAVGKRRAPPSRRVFRSVYKKWRRTRTTFYRSGLCVVFVRIS